MDRYKRKTMLLIVSVTLLALAFTMATIAIINAKMSTAERFSGFTVELLVMAAIFAAVATG